MSYARAVLVRAPQSRVWSAWTTPSWLAPRRRVDVKPGGAWEFFWGPDDDKDSTLGCKLLTVEPPRLLRFEWQGRSEFLDMFLPPKGRRTAIEVLLEDEGAGTRVTLVQAESREGEKWAAYEAWMSKAWEMALEALRKECERR